MTLAHVRPIAFSMMEAIWAAVACSPSCAEPNMPASPHDTGNISGIIARVKVRDPWANFEKPHILKQPPGLVDKVKMLMADHRKK